MTEDDDPIPDPVGPIAEPSPPSVATMRDAANRILREAVVVADDEESSRAHRGFLLWAMQDPARDTPEITNGAGRSNLRVARAVGVSETAVRKWRRRYLWDDRVRRLGNAAQQAAVVAYHREFHVEFGDAEVRRVADRMSVAYPPAPDGPAPVTTGPERDLRVLAREKQAERRRKLGVLVDATIGAYGRALTDGKLRISASDLFVIARASEMLTEPDPTVAKGGGPPVESVRVRYARAQGTNPLQAALEDVEELRVVLTHLVKPTESVSPGTATPEQGHG